MLHSHAPWMVPLPDFGSCSSNLGVFMYVKLERGRNMDAKNKNILFSFTSYNLKYSKSKLDM